MKSEEDFLKWMKHIFAGSKPRALIVGVGFCKGYRKEYGDKAFYEFLQKANLHGDRRVQKYVTKFVKKYEKKFGGK